MTALLDAAGRRRSPATMPGYHAGRRPRNKCMHYPADPPTIDEIVAVMRHTADDRHGRRLRAMIVVLWRAGLRIHEALALAEHGLDVRRGSLLVRHAHAIELAREGVPLNIIQRQLGHASLGTTSIYLQGIDPEEIITAVRTRRPPMMSASAGLRL
jgi:site-specific recombinase XerD